MAEDVRACDICIWPGFQINVFGQKCVIQPKRVKRAEDEGFEPSRLSSTRVRDARTRPLCESSDPTLLDLCDYFPKPWLEQNFHPFANEYLHSGLVQSSI